VPARLAPNPLGHVGPLTVHTALSRYCDLLSAPRKSALAALAQFANSTTEAAALRKLAGKQVNASLSKLTRLLWLEPACS
jgi:sulfite reductase alpha subunit-like flavoprotein